MKSPESKLYTMGQAEEEASKIQKKIESGEAKDHSEAEKQLAAEKEFENFLNSVHTEKAIEIQSKYNLSEDFVKTVAQKALLKHLSEGNFNTCFSIENNFKVSPREFSDTERVRLATIKGIKASFTPGRVGFSRPFGTVEEVKKRYGISEEVVQSIARENILEDLLSGYSNSGFEIAKRLELPGEVLQSAVAEAIEIKLKDNKVLDARELKDEFDIPEDVLKSVDKEGRISKLESMEKEEINKKAQEDAKIRDNWKEMDKKLSKMPPLYNEEEYLEMDPEQLLKKHYEADFKKYIGEKNKLTLPDFFSVAHNAPYRRHQNRGQYIEISGNTVSQIYNFAKEMAFTSIYFENNREIARQVLTKAFEACNNSKQTDNLTGEKNFWFELETVSGFSCVCNISEHLGHTANSLGFPDLAERFRLDTYCPQGPQYPGPALIKASNMEVTDYDRKNGYRVNYEKYSPEENQENIQSIKRQIMRHIEREIGVLKSKKEVSKSE